MSPGLFLLKNYFSLQEIVISCRNVSQGGLMNQSNLGTFKQTLLAINNEVNHEVFGRGLHSQKVYIVDNAIFIIAINHRVPALATLDNLGVPTREIDLVLIDAHKRRLRELIQERLDVPVLTVLKDYDPKHQISINIIILEESLRIEE